MHFCLLFLLLIAFRVQAQKVQILDKDTELAVSYATVSFGNGHGLFADDDGYFVFTERIYPNVDSITISALGYTKLKLGTGDLNSNIRLKKKRDMLKEVLVVAEKKRKFKRKKIPSKLHNNYFKCWLPTVESEIAVFFASIPDKTAKIASVYLPIKKEISSKKSKRNQRFSTLFKMQFYQNKDGYPSKRLPYEDVIFRITNQSASNFELDISRFKVYIPKNGIYISIQVLGYTDAKGRLQHTKKYSEIETKKGIVKISTTFRPLLPFTNQIDTYKTFTRRIFFKNRTWQRFDQKYSNSNKLLKTKHANYGMGLKLQLFSP